MLDFWPPTQTPDKRLTAIIQRRLPSQDQARLNALRQRLQDETITDLERQELLTFVDRVEAMDVKRAEAMVQLAQLRNVDLNIIIQEFLSKSQPFQDFRGVGRRAALGVV
ncbi:MAG: hypothetical protein HC857_04795 [Synechococcales cyanobacterium RU_4_20]|nr:hypothetical protein [Synechococcales cyanobacterium RU_4_20]